jgi:predicted aspartyl protease
LLPLNFSFSAFQSDPASFSGPVNDKPPRSPVTARLTKSCVLFEDGSVTRAIHRFLFIFVFGLSSPFCWGAVKLDALGAYLISQGYGGAQLVRTGQYYHLPIVANGKPANLIVDTGAPTSLIFRRSLKQLELSETKTDLSEGGAFGKGKQAFGVTTIGTLTAGNCTLTNVPVAVANDDAALTAAVRPNGLLGLRELVKFGAVVDLSHRLIYLRPSRPGSDAGASIRSMLQHSNYTAISLSPARGHLRVPGKVNDVPCHFLVDSGAFVTVLDRGFARSARLGAIPARAEAHSIGKSSVQISLARFSSLWVGDYQIHRASATVADLSSSILNRGTDSEAQGLLGIEYLGLNSAIFDFVSGTMYLRPRAQ